LKCLCSISAIDDSILTSEFAKEELPKEAFGEMRVHSKKFLVLKVFQKIFKIYRKVGCEKFFEKKLFGKRGVCKRDTSTSVEVKSIDIVVVAKKELPKISRRQMNSSECFNITSIQAIV
jgi:hypothetical protein